MHTRVITADGGPSVQKAARILAQSQDMPNIVLILRDPAHAIRIAARDPLHAEARFKSQLDRLFGTHGLVPDVQYSDMWKLKLAACQLRVLSVDGTQGGGLTKVMRHFAFAKQRFDSFAAPLRKYCCALHAIALLLAMVAADKRLQQKVRARAVTALEEMTEANLVTAGLSADYAEECADFIRIFDTDDHDISRTGREVRAFLSRMKTLFLDAHILAPPPHGETVTSIVLSQCRQAKAIPYGERIKILWTKGSERRVREVMESMHVVVQTMLERVGPPVRLACAGLGPPGTGGHNMTTQ